MKTVFGPVPSRRLRQSLGIDPIPLKTCNWNCVYCQLGRTMPITNERKAFFDPELILAETAEALKSHQPDEIDWVTFIGSGETTLDINLGYLIREVKKLTPLPIAVITNGSLFYKPEVRQDLLPADAVMPSFDAGNEALYRKINRPHPELTFDRLVEGLIAFRQEYSGNLWIEVMMVRGLNDSEAALEELAVWFERIHPDEIHILQPTRPPVEVWVEPADQEGIIRAQAILGKAAKIVVPVEGSFDIGDSADLVEAITNIVTRPPMRQHEVIEVLRDNFVENIPEALAMLEKSKKVKVVLRNNEHYWIASETHFPENGNSKEV